MSNKYVKTNGEWHIVDHDTKVHGRSGYILLCTGASVIKGLPESEEEKGDDAPLCTLCLNPLPDAVKAKLHRKPA